MVLMFYRSKEERLAKLEQKLQKKIKFYNSGNSTNLSWTKAEIILLLDNIEYENNPVGVFESSSTRVKEIISSGKINNFEITKDGQIIENKKMNQEEQSHGNKPK